MKEKLTWASTPRHVVTSAGHGVTAAIRVDHYITDHFDNEK
jgi:hypothetical protein